LKIEKVGGESEANFENGGERLAAKEHKEHKEHKEAKVGRASDF